MKKQNRMKPTTIKPKAPERRPPLREQRINVRFLLQDASAEGHSWPFYF
jgi:hypothetical protein